MAPEGASRCRAVASGLTGPGGGQGSLARTGEAYVVIVRKVKIFAHLCDLAGVVRLTFLFKWLFSTGRNDWSKIMKCIQASVAKTHLPELLDEVERGATIVITRHGKPIARLIPDEDTRREEALQAMREMREARKTAPRATIEEILAWRDEGRK
jgi:prevent-host-death family protein